MDAFIRPARPDDVDRVAALLHAKMDPKIPRERWRRLMTHGWRADEPELGRVVEQDGRVCGFLGMICADRRVDGRTERIVNLSSWYLDRDLRRRGPGFGMGLMRAALADRARTYTVLTASKLRLPIFRALGFRVLDDTRLVWRRAAGDPRLTVTRDAAAVRAAVDAAQRRLIDDHAGLDVTPVLAARGGARCLLLFAIVRKGAGVETWDVLHASDRGFLARHGAALAAALLPDGPAALAADRRLVDGDAPGAVVEPLATPRFFVSPRLAPAAIDNLYSEVSLLGLKLD